MKTSVTTLTHLTCFTGVRAVTMMRAGEGHHGEGHHGEGHHDEGHHDEGHHGEGHQVRAAK
jgi:hypothetical protein